MRVEFDKLTDSAPVDLSKRKLQHGTSKLKKKFTDDTRRIIELKKDKFDENEKNIPNE